MSANSLMLRARGWQYALLGALGGALALTAWLAIELPRVTGGLGWRAAAPAGFALVCNLAAPALPYLSAALIPSALAVMAPCLLQMSVVLATAAAGVAARAPGTGRPVGVHAGLRFGLGFVLVYAGAALALGLAGQWLASYAWALRALGGALVLLLGLAVLRVLPAGALSGCRGPRWLIVSGKASLRRPLGAGAAFAVYCVGCCGPYLGGLALLGAGAGWQGAALVGGFALLMAGLLLLPIVALAASRQLFAALQRHGRVVAPAAGAALAAIGAALLLEPALVWAYLALR